jgi:hypothetical protein
MPHYFFHTHIGDDVIMDPEGRELADPDAAYEAAKVLALGLLQDAGTDSKLLRAVLYVSDDAKELILEFPVTEALVAAPVEKSEGGTHH